MGVINVLDKHIADLIAAGEVVERPSSVIKELVENSIDAGATAITVEIKNGGTTFMRVNDNGCGIMRDDVKKAFLPHATSKVKSEVDLDKIATLGFRGEALSSICAVSRVELITKNVNENVGTCYIISGGEECNLNDAGCPNGTTIIIRDLFYNIPARMKFLKKDVSEGNAISYVIDKIALSHPEISITYIKDGKNALKTSGDGKLMSAIYTVYGRDFANGLIPVDYSLNGVSIAGYISKPVNARPNRNMQNFFINGRFVKSRTAAAALEEACKGSVMVGKFPSCVINISLSFEAVDVNVHPSKIEVRFINERPIFDAIYHGVKTAILTKDERKQVVLNNSYPEIKKVNPFESQQFFVERNNSQKNFVAKNQNIKSNVDDVFSLLDIKEDKLIENNSVQSKTEIINNDDLHKSLVQNSIDNLTFSDCENPLNIYSPHAKNNSKNEPSEFLGINNHVQSSSISNVSQQLNLNSVEEIKINNSVPVNNDDKIKPLIQETKSILKYIGEVFSTYILVERNEKELLLIDKHAAHERMIYEQLKKDKGNGYMQILLEPVAVTLNKIDYNSVLQNIDLFAKLGFEVEEFGNGVILVRSAPQYLENVDIGNTIVEMAGYLTENKNDISTEQMDWIYHNIACRSAIKAGNKSTTAELMMIANKLEEDNNLRYCPHGRPVCIELTKYEIEKQFGRV